MHPVINIEHLTRYNRDEANSWMKLKDLRAMGREIKYKVDRILGHHFNWAQKCMEYLVQWKGYGLEHDTFEPESHLRNAFLRLRQYKEELLDLDGN